MAGKTVVILGGGVGGLVAANELRRRLGKEHRVTLVDQDGRHIFWPSLLWLQVGLREPDSIVRDLSLLGKKGVEVIKGEVRRIAPERKTVQIDGRELAADYLVISLGAQLSPEQIPGLTGAGHNLYAWTGPPLSATPARLSLRDSWWFWWREHPSNAQRLPTRQPCSWTMTCASERCGTGRA